MKYEFTEDFELLRRAVRAEEYEMNQFSSLRQHQAGSAQQKRQTEEEKLTESSKIDQLIEGIQTLTKEVKAGNKRTRFRPWFNKEEQQERNTGTETAQESQKNKQPLNQKKSSTRDQLKTVLLQIPMRKKVTQDRSWLDIPMNLLLHFVGKTLG